MNSKSVIVSAAACSFLALVMNGCVVSSENAPPSQQTSPSASPTAPGDGVPAFSTNVIYLTVAPGTSPGDSPKVAEYRASFGGQTVVYSNDDPSQHTLMCTHSDVEMIGKYAENKTPAHEACAAMQPGSSSMPAGIDGTWSGSSTGGCGTWATAMCNRILGDTDAKTQVSKQEWNDIASAIKQDASGGSNMIDRAAYYRSKGYCTTNQRFGGATADYDEMTRKLNEDGCDVKLSFFTRKADGTYANGHVETVTGASRGGATTNSWGKQGIVQGGSSGNFSHSEDGAGKSFHDASGQKLWPAGSTEVWVSYVCKCGFFEGLMQ